MKSFVLTFFALIISFQILAQAQCDSISIVEPKRKVNFTKCGITLTPGQLFEVLKEDPATESEVNPASLFYLSNVLLNSGGILMVTLGIEGAIFRDEDPDWVLTGIGVAAILGAIPLKKAFQKRAKKAVNIYNENYRAGTEFKPQWSMGISQNGVGLSMNF